MFIGIGNHGDFCDVVVPAGDGEADAVNRDLAFWHDIAREFFRHLHAKPPTVSLGRQMRYAANGVHVAEYEVSAKLLSGGKWLLEIDAGALLQPNPIGAERSFANGLAGKIGREAIIVEISNGQTAAIHGDAVRDSK